MPRVVHFEIHAENPQRAAAFYAAVFDWEITKWGGPMDYWLIKTGPDDARGINGGMIVRHGPGPVDGHAVGSYVCTVDVPSVDDYIGKITAAGGRVVVPKMAIPQIGWLAYAKDTEGNIFGFLQPDMTAK
jgi:predicted enzyme related to lactoylglutathione lyase